MEQKSSKQRAEEAVLDLKGKLRQLNKTLASKGATIEENAPLVDTIKAVEGMKEQAVTMSIFKRQQFFGYVDESLPPLRISERYNPALIDYCFAQNRALKNLPSIENIGVAVNLSSFASSCGSLIEVSLGALTNATNISKAFESCSALTRATIGDAPKVTDASFMFSGCNKLEEVSIDLSGGLLTNFAFAFSNCSSLRRVTGAIDLSNANSPTAPFNGCSSLEEVRIKGLKVDLDLSACANLSVESVRYLVENAQNVTGKRIDLSRALLDANEEALGDLGDTASDKGWTINYR
uniref:Leucine-rich repeat protein n=1 Tax=Siphoviridae sp. ctfYP22 TaxID=2827584 RepID=A0A8S5LIT8_9CAUD|nr:MAG TPA: leucine-rich repeat protein [Siphoviridae sp. ctfYP22]